MKKQLFLGMFVFLSCMSEKVLPMNIRDILEPIEERLLKGRSLHYKWSFVWNGEYECFDFFSRCKKSKVIQSAPRQEILERIIKLYISSKKKLKDIKCQKDIDIKVWAEEANYLYTGSDYDYTKRVLTPCFIPIKACIVELDNEEDFEELCKLSMKAVLSLAAQLQKRKKEASEGCRCRLILKNYSPCWKWAGVKSLLSCKDYKQKNPINSSFQKFLLKESVGERSSIDEYQWQ